MIKKLLLLGILLGVGQSLGRSAIANDTSTDPQTANDTRLSSTADVETSAPSSETQTASSPLHRFLISNLILPLPPLLIPDLLLPPYDFSTFNSYRLDQELKLYTQYLRTQGTPDILIVGSSRSLQGIDPAALQEGLAQQGYPGLKVFNLGINGGTAQVNEVLLRQILTAEQLPRLIIWGDGSRAFNNGRPDLTYNGILASPGYQRVARGERPIPSQARWDLPVLRAAASKALSEASSSASSSGSAPAPQPIAPDLNELGFHTVTEVYDPKTYYQRYPFVPGTYDGDYQKFNLNGAQQAATVAVAQFARSQSIPLVFVNLPLTADYLDTTRRNYEQQFRQNMQQLAQQEQFIFADLSQQSSLMQNGYFADPSHINQHGARAIALHLTKMESIPWEMFRSSEP
ncbi:hypothetical protein IFO70_18835 [Phormidium tenue FACHB-886]|nr:hypothetical protein [Phormidium tenue FACHB-886]